ncbi:MAG: hypothetical protein QXL06_01875 [Nitrososphaerota archaeon]
MRVTKCIINALSLPDDATAIIQSSHYPWNGWVVREWDNDFYDFRTGIFDEYIEHLLECENCRKELNMSLERIKAFKKEIDEYWEEVMG